MSPATTSVLASHIALGAAGLVVGYYIGLGRSLFSYRSKANRRAGEEDESDIDSDSDDGEDLDLTDEKKMNVLKAGLMEECKLVLLVRTDLKMDKGKIAAQCSHATLACYKSMLKSNPKLLHHWERIG